MFCARTVLRFWFWFFHRRNITVDYLCSVLVLFIILHTVCKKEHLAVDRLDFPAFTPNKAVKSTVTNGDHARNNGFRLNEDRRRIQQQDAKTRFDVSQNQLCFVHILLRTGMLYNCNQDGTFSTEDMINPLLVLSLLKIISLNINGNTNSIRKCIIDHINISYKHII